MMPNDDREFEFREPRDEGDPDPDTNLILDYLSNKLDPEDVEALEQRAKKDKDFRYKLADIVLLKGLVMLALEKNPGPEARDCRQAQRLFLDYLKGRASVEKTAQLSRHLDECFECELAFERFQEHEGEGSTRGRQGGIWRRLVKPGRPAVIAGLVVLALAAGAFGIVGFLSSAGSAPAGPSVTAPNPASSGLVADQVRSKLNEILAGKNDLDAAAVSQTVDALLDPTQNPVEREANYAKLAAFGTRMNPLLWIFAANEPSSLARTAAYQAIQITDADLPALLAAYRRELDAKPSFHTVLWGRMAPWSESFAALVRTILTEHKDRKDRPRADLLRFAYKKMRGDSVIEERMTAFLQKGVEDEVRSVAAQGALEAENLDAMPVAWELLGSESKAVRRRAALAIARVGSPADCKKLADMDWSQDPDILELIATNLRNQGTEPKIPKNP